MLQSIKGIAKNAFQGVEILQCKINSISPLSMQVVDDPKRIIPEKLIIKARNVTDHIIKADIKQTDINQSKISIDKDESETPSPTLDYFLMDFDLKDCDIKIKNALKINEIVIVLAFNDAQKFVIMDRVG